MSSSLDSTKPALQVFHHIGQISSRVDSYTNILGRRQVAFVPTNSKMNI